MEEEKLKFKEIKESDEDEQVEKTEINALGKGVEEMTSKMSDLEEKKTELEPKPQTEAEQMKEVDKGIKDVETDQLITEASAGEHEGEEHKGEVREVDEVISDLDKEQEAKQPQTEEPGEEISEQGSDDDQKQVSDKSGKEEEE